MDSINKTQNQRHIIDPHLQRFNNPVDNFKHSVYFNKSFMILLFGERFLSSNDLLQAPPASVLRLMFNIGRTNIRSHASLFQSLANLMQYHVIVRKSSAKYASCFAIELEYNAKTTRCSANATRCFANMTRSFAITTKCFANMTRSFASATKSSANTLESTAIVKQCIANGTKSAANGLEFTAKETTSTATALEGIAIARENAAACMDHAAVAKDSTANVKCPIPVYDQPL